MKKDYIDISELNRIIKSKLENELPTFYVMGEISNFVQHSSGHRYFSLKDDKSQINCLMWRSKTLSFKPMDGMKVLVSGKISVYPPRGSYQLDVSSMQTLGEGELYLAFERLKNELLQAGYFEQERKKILPSYPQKIGISTSPTGAAIQDILSTLARRIPYAEIYFYPVKVQGENSELDIVKGIKELDKLGLDLIIIGRGGGSIEDLWSYNTKEVADAIYNSKTPIISGVGHETDTTIADFVADLRAPTPTGAAEIVSSITKNEIVQTLDTIELEINKIINLKIENVKQQLLHSFSLLNINGLLNRVSTYKKELLKENEILQRRLNDNINRRKVAIESLQRVFESLNPYRPLDKGFALLKFENKRLDAESKLQKSDEIEIIRKSQINKAIIKE